MSQYKNMSSNPIKQKASKSSKKARRSAARLAASQAVYQMLMTSQSAASLIREYPAYRFLEDVEGEEMILPDGALFTQIVSGTAQRRGDVEPLLQSHLGSKTPETLLLSILLCATYELMAHPDIDPPIIINDYLNVTAAFFDQNEKKLVNGVLDRIRVSLS